MNPLERYEPLVDDAAAFRAACDRPLPSVVRVNEMAASPARVREAFDGEGVAYEPVDWHDGLFRLPDGNPGGNWPYVHGWTHGQEEVSVLPGARARPAARRARRLGRLRGSRQQDHPDRRRDERRGDGRRQRQQPRSALRAPA